MIMTPPPPPPLRRRSDAWLSDRNDTQAIGLYYDTSHLSCAGTCGQTFRFSGALLPACACACARCPVPCFDSFKLLLPDDNLQIQMRRSAACPDTSTTPGLGELPLDCTATVPYPVSKVPNRQD